MAVDAADPVVAPRRYGVAGWPVSHSRSPQMHRAAYEARGVDAIYQRLPLPPELFEETVRALPKSGFAGINVTIPHKEAALKIASEASEVATAVGAANTLTFRGSEIVADNTDAPGLIAALGHDIADAEALVLGAGGTARAAVWALLEAGARVLVWNRTSARAAELASQFGVTAVEEPGAIQPQIVVNTTALGMNGDGGELLELVTPRAGQTVVDFVYSDEPTALISAAVSEGCRTVDGRELLARQGALSFALWFGGEPPYDEMLAAIG